MRNILLLVLWLWPVCLSAQDWEDQQFFGNSSSNETLSILSSTDTSFFEPIIIKFLQKKTDWNIEYLVTGTADIDRVYRANPDRFDLVISSAMDLQLKLVNDGFALELAELDHPHWAHWRQRLFAFTSEPATIVINRKGFEGLQIPRTRQELIQALRSNPDKFRGKIGTYDVRQSGLGYLFATQDARASETFWRLMEVMGSLNAKLYCCSGQMIDDVAEGNLLVAYNVLGSYADARQQQDNRFEIVLPSDFPATMMRTGFVSKNSGHPAYATAFINHLVETQTDTEHAGLFPLPPLASSQNGAVPSTISLDPALLTYLDKLKRRTFVKEWMDAVIQ